MKKLFGKIRGPLSALLITLSLISLIAVTGFRGSGRLADLPTAIVGPCLLCILMACAIWNFRVKFLPPTGTQEPRTDRANLDVTELLVRAERSRTSRSETQIHTFIKSITRPTTLRTRIVEEIRPLRRVLRQNVTSHIIIPAPNGNQDDHYYVPVLMAGKGDLQDDLTITLEDGSSAPILRHRDYLTLATHAIHMLLTLAGVEAEFSGRLWLLEQRAIKLIAQTADDLENADECAQDLNGLENHAAHPYYLWDAARFVVTLAKHYPVVAVVPSPRDTGLRTIIKHERYTIPRLKLVGFKKNPIRYTKERLGLLLGARPIEVELDLGNSAAAASFHIHVFGPEGTYLGLQNVPQLATLPDTAYARFRRRLGQAYAHAYFRSVPPQRAANLRYRVQFVETPPGSISKASLAAGANLMLMYAAAALLSGKLAALPSDFPILILTIPAAVSAWIGLDTSGRQLVEGTLSSRLSSVFTAALSILSSGLYLAQVGGALRFDENVFVVLRVNDSAWLALILLALVNFLVATYLWIGRAVAFFHLANRDIERTSAANHPIESA